MRYFLVLIGYLIATAFYPTLMGGVGLVALIGWLIYFLRRIFAPPLPVTQQEVNGVQPFKPMRGTPRAAAPEPASPPSPAICDQDQVESDEEFLARMRAMNEH